MMNFVIMTLAIMVGTLLATEDDVKDSSSIILPDLTIYIKDNIDKSELKDKLTKEFEEELFEDLEKDEA